MIASKQIAFGKAAGAKKPYDAEVEYLGSFDSQQWIDMGLKGNQNIDYELKFFSTDLSIRFQSIMGDRLDSSSRRCSVMLGAPNSGAWEVYFNNGNTNEVVVKNLLDVTEPFVVVKRGSACYLNGSNFGSFPKSTEYETPFNLVLFGTRTNGVFSNNFTGRIYYAKIFDNGILVRDFIPVRKGNIGYMYDRVSGQLFGNQGTGEFVLGPDIIDYTAKDYIQDGLVGFYDSIENLGPGLSDDSGSFKEWVSGHIASSLKGIVFDSSRTPGVMDALAGTGKTIEVCVKNVAFDSTSSLQRNLFSTSSVGQTSFQIRKSSVRYAYVLLDGTEFPAVPLSDFFSATFSITRNESAMNFAQNGSTVKSKEISSTPSSFTRFQTMGDDSVVTYELCRVSIHNRALTAEEVAHNYEIDKARFGLP